MIEKKLHFTSQNLECLHNFTEPALFALDKYGFAYDIYAMYLKMRSMKQKVLAAIEQVELFTINNPIMSQQIMDNVDDLFWGVYPLIDSIKWWLCQWLLT